MKKLLNNLRVQQSLGLLLISIIVCLPLLYSKFNIYADDGIQHICRLIGTFQMLKSGQFLPEIMSNFCNNFGYSWNLFYSPLTAYGPLLLKIFNLSYVNCMKIFELIVTFASGMAMYKFVENVTKNKNMALLAGIIYILAPYRITDMYIRNAFAELTSFVFLPIIFNGLYKIVNQKEKSYMLAWGTIGLILTHTVITMYTAILCAIYLIVFIKKLKDKRVIINLLINLLIVLLATSFFWVGLLQSKIATTYEVFVPGRMQRLNVLEYYKVEFYQLFYTDNNQTMIYAIGLVTVIGLILTPVAFKKIEKEYKKSYVLFLIMGLSLTFMTLTIFPFEKLPNILTMLQFTFRLFEFTSFFFAFVVAVNLVTIIKNFSWKDICVLTILMIILLIPYLRKIDFNISRNEEDYIEPVPVTENTGRVHAGMASLEYLPSKAFNNLNYLINRKDEPIILNEENLTAETLETSQPQIIDYKKDGSNMQFTVTNVNTDISVELPYIYYVGYRVYLNGKEVKYTESDNGFVQIDFSSYKNNSENESVLVEVKYTGTNAMILAFIISIITMLGLLFEHFYSKICMLEN